MVPGNVTPERNGPNRMFLVMGLKNKTIDPKCPSNNATTSTSSSALEKAQRRLKNIYSNWTSPRTHHTTTRHRSLDLEWL
jgi:hypothetical protein